MTIPGSTVVQLEVVRCPKCFSNHSRVVYQGKDYLYRIPGDYFVSECQKCGLWFQNPGPVPKDVERLYPGQYAPHTGKTASDNNEKAGTSIRKVYGALKRTAWALFRKFFHIALPFYKRRTAGIGLIPTLVRDGRLLEIGCADGKRLAGLHRAGWRHLYGIELVSAAADRAREQGFTVECGPVEKMLVNYPDEYFDVVVASMVLEHLYNPFQIVDLIASKLKPGGQFLFSTICRDSFDAKVYGRYWAGFDFPRHMVHLREDDIKDMLNARFRDVHFYYQNAPVDFIRSSQWRRTDNGKTKMIDKIVLFLGERGLFPFSLILSWLGLTCRISVRCRKK